MKYLVVAGVLALGCATTPAEPVDQNDPELCQAVMHTVCNVVCAQYEGEPSLEINDEDPGTPGLICVCEETEVPPVGK